MFFSAVIVFIFSLGFTLTHEAPAFGMDPGRDDKYLVIKEVIKAGINESIHKQDSSLFSSLLDEDLVEKEVVDALVNLTNIKRDERRKDWMFFIKKIKEGDCDNLFITIATVVALECYKLYYYEATTLAQCLLVKGYSVEEITNDVLSYAKNTSLNPNSKEYSKKASYQMLLTLALAVYVHQVQK